MFRFIFVWLARFAVSSEPITDNLRHVRQVLLQVGVEVLVDFVEALVSGVVDRAGYSFIIQGQ